MDIFYDRKTEDERESESLSRKIHTHTHTKLFTHLTHCTIVVHNGHTHDTQTDTVK